MAAIPRSNRRLFQAIAVAFLAAHAAWADSSSGICSKIEALQASDRNDPVEALFRRKYPEDASCASWLARSCLSPLRLDHPGTLHEILSQPWRSVIDGVPTLPVTPSLAPVSSCDQDTRADDGLDVVARITGALEDPMRTTRERFAREALHGWALMERKREQDFQVIRDFLRKYSIPRKFAMASSSADPKDGSGNDFTQAIATLLRRVNSAIDMDSDPDTRRYLNLYVGQQIIQASSDLVTPLRNGGEDRQLGMYNRLLQEPSDQRRFDLLLQRAYDMDASDGSDVDGFITSYHAKMLLLYYIDNQIHRKLPATEAENALNELAQQLQLKADFTPDGEPTQWKYIVPHNGFVLGATSRQVANLWAPSFKPGDDAGSGTGTDCTKYYKSNLERFGYPVSSREVGEFDSGRILQKDGILSAFSSAPVRLTDSNAGDLEPGDSIIFGPQPDDPFGHAEMVVGYAGDPPQPVVVSARGGYVRGIIKETVNIFPEAPKNCASDSYFSGGDAPPAYRVRLIRPPRS